MTLRPHNPEDVRIGSVRRCWTPTCKFHVRFTENGWEHINTHGELVDHIAAPRHVGVTHQIEGFLFCGNESPHGPHIHEVDEHAYECEGVNVF